MRKITVPLLCSFLIGIVSVLGARTIMTREAAALVVDGDTNNLALLFSLPAARLRTVAAGPVLASTLSEQDRLWSVGRLSLRSMEALNPSSGGVAASSPQPSPPEEERGMYPGGVAC